MSKYSIPAQDKKTQQQKDEEPAFTTEQFTTLFV